MGSYFSKRKLTLLIIGVAKGVELFKDQGGGLFKAEGGVLWAGKGKGGALSRSPPFSHRCPAAWALFDDEVSMMMTMMIMLMRMMRTVIIIIIVIYSVSRS